MCLMIGLPRNPLGSIPHRSPSDRTPSLVALVAPADRLALLVGCDLRLAAELPAASARLRRRRVRPFVAERAEAGTPAGDRGQRVEKSRSRRVTMSTSPASSDRARGEAKRDRSSRRSPSRARLSPRRPHAIASPELRCSDRPPIPVRGPSSWG